MEEGGRMETPKIDKRSKEDLLANIKEFSSAYTPEWRFDEDNLDVGGAMAYMFAEMYSKSIGKFNQVLDKNMLTFFKQIGATPMPAEPATGYVQFKTVSKELGGFTVPKGSKLLANEDQEELIFETQETVSVVPASLEEVFVIDGKGDRILHQRLGEDSPNIKLFQIKGNNIQEHWMFLSHEDVLNIKGGGTISLKFLLEREEKEAVEQLERLFTSGDLEIEYYSEDGYQSFQEVTYEDTVLQLYKGEYQPAFALLEVEGVESYWIRCKLKQIKDYASMKLQEIRMGAESSMVLAESVYVDGVEQEIGNFFPFGERMNVYSELYIACEEALCKKGASITCDFQMDFRKIPLELEAREPNINWKLIMKNTDFKPDPDYDITISQVVWEYFNGVGWTRLFKNQQYATMFNSKKGTMLQNVQLSFVCPADMDKILVNALDTYHIRARVLGVNNAFKMKGNYISPVISNLSFSYNYEENKLAPSNIFTMNNLEQCWLNQKETLVPFKDLGHSSLYTYFGFDLPLEQGPIKMLFSMEKNYTTVLPKVNFEFYTKRGWKDLRVLDGTQSFRRSGILTVLGEEDFYKTTFWNRNQNWVRVKNLDDGYYDPALQRNLPEIIGLHMNSVKVLAVNTREPETYHLDPRDSNLSIKLLHNHIVEMELWVDEKEYLLKNSVEKEQLEIQEEKNAQGFVIHMWTKWKRCPSYTRLEEEERQYYLDTANGMIYFSRALSMHIYKRNNNDNIKLQYTTGGGAVGNVGANQVNKMMRYIGYINEVTNAEPMTLGCNLETPNTTMLRSARELRHGGRAVTKHDFEDLALEASRSVIRAKCFPNRDDQGAVEFGMVTLVVLQRNFLAEGRHFEDIRRSVEGYLEKRMPANMRGLKKLTVIQPKYIYLSIQLVAVVKEYFNAYEIKNQITKKLQTFLNPIEGNFNGRGWDIGQLPNTTQVTNILKQMNEIVYIKKLYMRAYDNYLQENGEVDIDDQKNTQYILILNGQHQIDIEME